MGVREGELSKFETFTGLNNRDREPLARGNVLREAVDVDLTKLGKIQSRRGYSEPLVPCALGHSLWADPEDLFPFGLYADGEALHALNPDLTTALLRTGLSVGLDVSYARVNDSVFWSNDAECGMVDAMGDVAAWACENPSGQPALQAIDGALGAGLVQVCITFADTRGRESGATLAADITLAAGQGVQLLKAPGPARRSAIARIQTLGSGGGTPIASCLQQAQQVLHSYRLRHGSGRRTLWLLTDGRSTERPAAPAAADAG